LQVRAGPSSLGVKSSAELFDGSAAAARTKASTAALTVVMIALPGEVYCAARPVVRVMAPLGRTLFIP
jgi:hypothetical protein